MTTFFDDFNRSNGSPGANWVDSSGLWTIASQQLTPGTAGGTIIIRAATAMSTSDNSAQVTIAATGAVSHGVWCRGDSTFTQGYLWRNNGTSWDLFSVVGGSFTNIGTYSAAAVTGDVAKIQAVGSTIKGLVNGVVRVTATNTAVTSGTGVGLRAESSSLLKFDDFTGADVTSGATGDAALAATATLTATGVRTTSGDAALAATATLNASGVRTTTGDAAIAATATLTASGLRSTSGDTALTATASLTADGTRTTSAGAALTATATLTASGTVTRNGDAALAATASFTADGQRTATADAGLTATATLTADGARATFATAGLTATAALAAAGTTALVGGASLAATATLTASGTVQSTQGDTDITVSAPYSPWTAWPVPGWAAADVPGPWTAKEAP